MAFKRTTKSDVAVLGAGITGSVLALELARLGRHVDLFDLSKEPVTGASLHNEGKLHLGYVYANDPDKESHSLMAKGSLCFGRILEEVTSCPVGRLALSRRFDYFMPSDSQLSVNEISTHFSDVAAVVQNLSSQNGNDYLGIDECFEFSKNSNSRHASLFSEKFTLGSFNTNEIAISTHEVAVILREAINKAPLIHFHGEEEILSVDRGNSNVLVSRRKGGCVSESSYVCAVNCLWDDKLRVDETAGVVSEDEWLLRYKAMISVYAPSLESVDHIPSATGILGPYGDIVNHGNGYFYLGWYPLCKLSETRDNNGRSLHDSVHSWSVVRLLKNQLEMYPRVSEFLSSKGHRHFLKRNVREIGRFVPSIEMLMKYAKSYKVSGGVILARGNTDIDDPNSFLHKRSKVGVDDFGSYLTINTGKYCLGPMFAIEAANLVNNRI